MTHDPPRDPDGAVSLGERLVDSWGSWGPNMTPDARRVAFISDRRGTPELWVQDVAVDGPPPRATPIHLSDDPVVSVRWSADGKWLACAVATDGGVRTQVWVVRPDGTGARRIAGSWEIHAELGPWTRSGHRVAATVPGTRPGEPTRSYLVDPATGETEPLAVGDLIHVLDLSVGEQLVVLEDGRRGHQFCVVVDRAADQDHPLLPYPARGATEVALLRPAPPGGEAEYVAYLATDAGLPRRQLVAVALGRGGWRGPAGVLAARDDAELEGLDADDAGRLLLLVWNVQGRSEIELFDTVDDRRVPVSGLPGLVVTSPVLSRDGSTVILALEGPERPRELWRLDTTTHAWSRVTDVPTLPDRRLVTPTLETYTAFDGLRLTGWLYRVPGRSEPGPAMLHLHGGPEAQERPTFSPQHQAMAAAGIAVFAPNIRGSSGFGRAFVHADDLHGRQGAFDDVIRSAELLVELGVAEVDRIAVTGRSYGGYLTLASLAFSPSRFAAGVDICGMSDLLTFYRDTEPWIGAAAVTKYGHPVRDRVFLAAISPLHYADYIRSPLLVVHGELDTNVPIGEAHQIVEALRRFGRDVEYLELAGEGHEYRRASSRRLLVSTMVRFLTDRLGLARRVVGSVALAPARAPGASVDM
jgi:dipeptidyl aminopeptidase/acylaminoacyl peptidase